MAFNVYSFLFLVGNYACDDLNWPMSIKVMFGMSLKIKGSLVFV